MGFKNDVCIAAPKLEDLVEKEFLGRISYELSAKAYLCKGTV